MKLLVIRENNILIYNLPAICNYYITYLSDIMYIIFHHTLTPFLSVFFVFFICSESTAYNFDLFLNCIFMIVNVTVLI